MEYFTKSLIPLASSSGVNSNGGDFFALHNTGASAVNLTGWKWDDDSVIPASGATFGSVSIPAGGVLVVSNALAGTEAAFKTAWNLGGDVTVVVTGGPGLGGGDAVALFDSSNNFVTGFNYKMQVTEWKQAAKLPPHPQTTRQGLAENQNARLEEPNENHRHYQSLKALD